MICSSSPAVTSSTPPAIFHSSTAGWVDLPHTAFLDPAVKSIKDIGDAAVDILASILSGRQVWQRETLLLFFFFFFFSSFFSLLSHSTFSLIRSWRSRTRCWSLLRLQDVARRSTISSSAEKTSSSKPWRRFKRANKYRQ